MTRATTVLAWLLVASGCNKDSGGGSATPAGSAAATAPATGSAGGGFSADLAKQLDMGSAGSAGAGSAGAGSAGAGSAGAAMDSKAGSASAAVDPKAAGAVVDPEMGSAADPKAGAGTPAAGDAKVAAGDPKAAVPKAGAAAGAVTPKSGVAAADPKPSTAAATAPPGTAAKPPKPPSSVVIESGTGTRPPVSVPSELRAINISLLPNWERDVEAAGTISFRVKIPNRTESALFVFRYGYEDPKAPADRDAYKKWLADAKILTAKDDRQAGAAWYIEGTDASGKAAFRFVINYGGKKLVCYGSLYKDGASSALGDLRDQTILQAKQICETLAL